MTIRIQRGRQFLPDASLELFDAAGKMGKWLPKASEKLVAQGIAVTVTSRNGKPITLKTADDWSKFLAKNASTVAQTKGFASNFKMTFQDFCELVDDLAVSSDTNITVDATKGSELSKALHLDKLDNDYGSGLAKGAKVKLGATDAVGGMEASGVDAIGPEILNDTVGDNWERDRTEQESWADFKMGNGASKKFKEATGPAPFAKLGTPKWDDAEAMAIVERFNLPIHVEMGANAQGQQEMQDHIEMFRETYFDDRSGTLDKSGASVRARVRFDNDEAHTVRRVLVQAKEGRELTGEASAVHKFEKRWEGGGQTEQGAQEALMSGKDKGGSTLAVSQKLYKLAKERGALPADGKLRLEPQRLVLQRRRRTHMHIESSSETTRRRDALKTEIEAMKTAGTAVPPAAEKFLAKLDKQVAFATEASTLLQKYREYMPSGECFIVSADRYNVYDPKQRTTPPVDTDDEVGLVGKGIHVEAEWDTAASDPFENAVEKVQKELANTVTVPTPERKAELEKDLGRLQEMRATFRADVAQTVELLKARLVGAGLELDPTKASKDERAKGFMKQQESVSARSLYWL